MKEIIADCGDWLEQVKTEVEHDREFIVKYYDMEYHNPLVTPIVMPKYAWSLTKVIDGDAIFKKRVFKKINS